MLLTNWLQIWVPTTPSESLMICYNTSQIWEKNSLLTRLVVHYKRIQLRNSQMEEMHRVRHGGKRQVLFGCSTPPAPPHVHQPGSSLNPFSLGFLCRQHYIGTIDWIIGHWWSTQPPAPLSSPEAGGLGWKFQPSNQWLVPLATSPQLWGFSKSHLISINSGVVERGLLRITKGKPFTFIALIT